MNSLCFLSVYDVFFIISISNIGILLKLYCSNYYKAFTNVGLHLLKKNIG